jgi:uncharacterized protein
MTDDPESTRDQPTPGEPGPHTAAEPDPEPSPEPLADNAPILSWPAPQDPLVPMEPLETAAPAFAPLPPRFPRLLPHIGHFFVFVSLLIPAFVGGYLLTVAGVFATNPRGGFGAWLGKLAALTRAKDLLFALSLQAGIYLVLWGLAALVFGLWWKSTAGIGFPQGIHWNAATAKRWFGMFAILGVATGLVITLAGNFVPMPKAPPILEDLTQSPLDAWILMVFGITLAPLTEELGFRGFLLPGLINIFRWLARRQTIGEDAVRLVGIPVSIVLTSIPFALMHAEQVSNSWGPVLLIGCVSVVLCVVRLRARSLASSIIVHAFYNLTLFSGLLIQTDGFRHLDKLRG